MYGCGNRDIPTTLFILHVSTLHPRNLNLPLVAHTAQPKGTSSDKGERRWKTASTRKTAPVLEDCDCQRHEPTLSPKEHPPPLFAFGDTTCHFHQRHDDPTHTPSPSIYLSQHYHRSCPCARPHSLLIRRHRAAPHFIVLHLTYPPKLHKSTRRQHPGIPGQFSRGILCPPKVPPLATLHYTFRTKREMTSRSVRLNFYLINIYPICCHLWAVRTQ